MIRTFATQVEKTDEALQKLDTELCQTGEQLWEESAFGDHSHEFCQRVDNAFEEVIPTVEGPHRISRTIDVESWVFRDPIRVHSARVADRLKDFVRTLFGHYHPAAEYQRTVVPQKEPRTLSAVDTRALGGSGMAIQQNVSVKRPATPMMRAMRSRRRLVFNMALVHGVVSEAWWEAVRKSWQRLWGHTDVEAPFEPRLLNHEMPISIDIPPVTLEELSPPAQAYWKRRRELEAEVQNVTGFMHQWKIKVTDAVERTRQLKLQKDALEKVVATLPRPIEGQRKLQELQNRMQASERATEQYAQVGNELEAQVSTLLEDTKAARRETLGP